MSMFKWEPKMIEFMEDASKTTDYYRCLAEIIDSYIKPNSNICEVGCGLGDLSIAIAEKNHNVTALDLNETVIQILKEKTVNLKNHQAICADIYKFTAGKNYDTAIFCMFGNNEEIIEISKKLGCKQAVVIKRNHNHHRFTQDETTRRCTYSDFIGSLKNTNYALESQEFTLELNQPFRTLEDAVEFFKIYSKTKTTPEISVIKEKLLPINLGEFNYILPVKNNLGLIKIAF